MSQFRAPNRLSSPHLSSTTVEYHIETEQPYEVMTKSGYLTLAYGEMESLRLLPSTYAGVEEMAREWAQLPPNVRFNLRVPVEYLPVPTARLVQGPYLWISNDESYQILRNNVLGLRIEISTDAPPPAPLPPVLEMPMTLKLELNPGQVVAIDAICTSDDDLDMSRTEDGTLVAGNFTGHLEIIHTGNTHNMEFSGTRLTTNLELSTDIGSDPKLFSKLVLATKSTTAKCTLSLIAPSQQYCELSIFLSPNLWKLGMTWPPAELLSSHKAKYFLRLQPDGYLEHFESNTVVTSLYYEAMPDTSQIDPVSYISHTNGFAMPLVDFLPHLSNILDSLGLSIASRTSFVSNSLSGFSGHKNIAYRFMQPHRLSAAIDLQINIEACVWTRIFLMWRGVTDDEMVLFERAGMKEALEKDWKSVIAPDEGARDPTKFRALETSIMECA